jgi:aminoglycoside 6'-N-acetyltransferase
MAETDLDQIHEWLNNPAVAEWYGLDLENKSYPTRDEVVANYLPRIRGEVRTHGFVFQFDGTDAGYIQCYRIGDHRDYARALDHDDDAWGIDLFIGEDAFRGKGLATALLDRFVEQEVATRPNCSGVVICPSPDNSRAIRVYEKAGFRYLKTVWIPREDEYEYVMVKPAG